MADHVYDIDRNSIYPSLIKPEFQVHARGNGKSQAQLQIYDAISKGKNNIFIKEMEKWMKKNLGKVGVDLGADKICEATLKGENEMDVKETLNQIYGTSISTNATIKDDIKQEDIMNAIKTFEKDEYVWIKGFKGTDKDMRCQDYQYELDKQFDLDEDVEPVVCSKGFHFCKSLENVFRHYKIGDGHRFFEVEALVRKSDLDPKKKDYAKYADVAWSLYHTSSHYDDKYAAKSIRFIRELSVDEVFGALGTDCDVRGWTEEQKKRAMETSINAVRRDIRAFELCAAGYSPAFAKYISIDEGRYTTAMAMASLPDVSMDVKVMAIFLESE